MNIKTTFKYADEPGLDDLFVVKRANEWIMQSKGRPVPRMLFGELWIEGELAVLAAGPGMGKSLLGVQIAESIARGRSVGPLQVTARPQKVLYLDLKLSDKQFEMRYAAEHDDDDGEFLTNHYKFSDRFHRVEIDLNKPLPEGFRLPDEVLPRLLEKLVLKTGARVVVIDSITQVQHSIYGYRETHSLMRELRRLKRELGLSILVLARSATLDAARPAAGGSRLLARFADSVFTIGMSKQDGAKRYLKHISAHSTGIMYDSSHVPSFRISRIGGNFLGFEHEAFAPESAHLAGARDHRDWPKIQKIKEMSDTGMTIREIAAELELPKTSAHRMLQMWTPPGPGQRAEAAAPVNNPHDFPGCEEYDAAKADPRFYSMYTREDEEDYKLRREYNLLENARNLARKEYLETGKTPTLAEMLARPSDGGNGSQLPSSARGMNGEIPRPSDNGSEDIIENAPDTASTHAGVVPPADAGGSDNSGEMAGIKRSFDGYGREIFIEREDERGEPLIWTVTESKGNKFRKVRKPNIGIFVERVE